jgi:UDP-3-O-[3-hydroxymyristoyl] glucosamine N-acyltransferase
VILLENKDKNSYTEMDIESILTDLKVNYRSQRFKRKVRGVSSIKEATENDLSFCWYEGEKGRSLISNSNAGIVLCKTSMETLVQPKPGRQVIFLDNPRLVFIQIMNKMFYKKELRGVSPKAIISKDAEIGKDCYIGDFTMIGDNCKISDNTVIHNRVTILQNCFIGNNCIIQPGVVIGADGFAFERYKNGELESFPHIRGVKIANNVEICANSNIARGSLSDTIIDEGTKIDALVHIAHNVSIGKNCQLTAGTVIGGSTTIGNMCWTGLNSTLKDNIKIGNNVIVGAGAVVIDSFQDGEIVCGVPAKSIKSKVTSDKLFLMAGQESEYNKPSSL